MVHPLKTLTSRSTLRVRAVNVVAVFVIFKVSHCATKISSGV